NKLHCQIQEAIIGLPRIINGDRVGAIDAYRVSSFAFETGDRIVFSRREPGHQLDCTNSKIFDVNGAIDCAHSTLADLSGEPVASVKQLPEHRVVVRIDQYEV